MSAALPRQDRIFWCGLAFAAALHAAILFAVTRSAPRQMGERSGRPDGISVMLVDAADLASKNTFREDGATSVPAAPPQAAAPSAPRSAPEKAPEASVVEQPPAPPVELPQPDRHPRKQPDPPGEKDLLDALSLPPPAPKPKDAGKQAKPTPPLQLTIPNIPVAPGGRSAAVMRPPGFTRSGENDNFGRGVIRALRQTMPSPTGQLGRVTVRLFLSNSGNLLDVQLVRSAGIPGLDQSVVFAVKQASFPIPPAGATAVDRTFLVTYIYN